MTKTERYGILTDLQTGTPIRPATCEEWLISVRLVAAGQPEGAFEGDDGRAVFVAGGEEDERCVCGAPAGHAEDLQQLAPVDDLSPEQVDELQRIAAWLGREHKSDPRTSPEAAYLAAVEYMAGRTDVRTTRQKMEVTRAQKAAAQSAAFMVLYMRDAAMGAALRSYTGDDVWRDVVRPHEDYVAGSRRSDPDQFELVDNSQFVFRNGRWRCESGHPRGW